jgi:DNA-binding winged helix-turn-helix (wHTH) protein/tetratricopeptide (TPR) repeat protein
MNAVRSRLLEFGPFRINATRRVLLRDDDVVPLTAKVFDTLLVLAENGGKVLEKDELMARLWPNTQVEENNLTVNLSTLRRALGDRSSDPRYIETVPRRGYRFLPTVRESWERSSTAAADSTAASAHEPDTFVGREEEMRELLRRLRRAMAGSGSVACITGEPGIGKTALAEAFLRRVDAEEPSVAVGRGQCLEHFGTGEAYLPWMDAIGAVLDGSCGPQMSTVLFEAAPTWCGHFPVLLRRRDAIERLRRETIGATKERMLREFGDALAAFGASVPVVLLLEDLHWADPSSCDLLFRLSQQCARHRWLIVATFRPVEIQASQHPLRRCHQEMLVHQLCHDVPLGPLDVELVRAYLDRRFDAHEFPTEAAGFVHRRSEGHPLFATGFVQVLLDRGVVAKVDGRWRFTRDVSQVELIAPEGVLSLIRKSVEGLSEEDRLALQYASVEGEEFTSDVAAALLDTDPLAVEERFVRLDRCNRLISTLGEHELPDGTVTTRYRFAHVLYQNVLYADLVSGRRTLLHHAVGRHLRARHGDGARRVAAQLAFHFERGRDFGPAIEFLTHAGDNAHATHANDEALGHYERALGLVTRLPQADQAVANGNLYSKHGLVCHTSGRFDAAVEDFTRMLASARAAGAPGLEAAALSALGNTLFFAHRLGEVASRSDEALQLAERSHNEPLRIETLALIARRNVYLGHLAEAKPLLDECIASARAVDHRTALLAGIAWRGLLHFFQSEYDRAEETLTEALELSSELRNGFSMLMCLFFLGLTRGNRGRVSDALSTFAEAIAMARRNGDRNQLPKIPNSIAWLYRELGDLDRALEHDRAGLEMSRDHGVLEAEINSVINLGLDHSQARSPDRAVAAFRDAEMLLARDEWLRWRFELRRLEALTRHLVEQGDVPAAQLQAGALLETARHYEVHKYVALAHMLRAELAMASGQPETAEREIETALDELVRYPTPLVAWKAHALQARVLSSLGKTSAAREACAAATTVARQIAEHVTDGDLRQRFENLVSRSVDRSVSF